MTGRHAKPYTKTETYLLLFVEISILETEFILRIIPAGGARGRFTIELGRRA